MNRKIALSGLVILACAVAFPAAAIENVKFEDFFCLVDPARSPELTGLEFETFNSQLTCAPDDADADLDPEIHLKCIEVLSPATLQQLGIGKNQTKTFKKPRCPMDARRCDAGLGKKDARNSQLRIKGSNGEAKLECEW